MLNTQFPRWLSSLIWIASTSAFAQVSPANPGFEIGSLGIAPPGWSVNTRGGFGAVLVDQGCRTGQHCAMITGSTNPGANVFGNLMQSIPAEGYNQRRIRLRSAIRVEGADTRAQMWLRLDRADNSMAFLENMGTRPVKSPEWNTYDIETDVGADVSRIVFGVMLFGAGNAWVDDVSIEILGEILKDKLEPARPLTQRGLENVKAFAKLYGYVRFFHPSDQAAATDWENFAIEGLRTVEDATSTAELSDRLSKMFAPIAPSVRVYEAGKEVSPVQMGEAAEIIRYEHNGVGLPTAMIGMGIYSSKRTRKPAARDGLPPPFEASIGSGLRVSVPLALFVNGDGTLPHAPIPSAPPRYERSSEDRATRLAAVIIAWNVFQHFYPYFDVVEADWSAELPKALRPAAAGSADFQKTLQKLVAALKDGHGSVRVSLMSSFLRPPLTLGWVENQLIVTRVQKGKEGGVFPGDRVLKIDDVPVDKAASDARALISGATGQWIRYRLAGELSACDVETKKIKFELEPFADRNAHKTVELDCATPRTKDAESYPEPRPEKIAEIAPGIMYIDLDRISVAEWKDALPKLEKMRGIVFDMRGYPSGIFVTPLAHLTKEPLRSAKWNVSNATMPDQIGIKFKESGWPLPAEAPYLPARIVFLTDGRAISAAETFMGIVEHFKLGEIVGEPTAGTNGNVNPFKLPGGFIISWTGMKVLKHDGSQHHGVGILPTVPASRTRAGVAAGKDELLLKGLEVIQKK